MFLQAPSTEEEWLAVSAKFASKWNYPLCLGALDGKHIAIRQPGKSGSEFYNYKHFYSILLMALVDANYRFIYIDVGATGRSGDAGVFERSTLKAAMYDDQLSFPKPAQLVSTEETCCYHIVGDEAFPLRTDLMKPYPHRNLSRDQRIFNYRLSRARRVVENAFGILSSRFRVFLSTICLDAEKVEKLVLAAICLHNFLLDTQPMPLNLVDQEDDQHRVIPGTWRQDTGAALQDPAPTTTRNYALAAKVQRDMLKTYFSSPEGRVHWQDNVV